MDCINNIVELKMYKIYKIFSLALLAIGLFACDNNSSTTSPNPAGIYKAPAVALGDGQAYSWVELDKNGKPVSVGVNLTADALTGLGDAMTETKLQVPSQASGTNLDHVMIDWNPHGHEPAHIYDLPHFDFHFYMVDDAFLSQITAVGADTLKTNKQPAAGYLAPGYVLPPGGVPDMGNHAVDMTSGEFNGKTFTETYIYGYYNGNMIFYEPMITVAYLMSKPDLTKPISVPQKFPKTGYYPTQLMIKFNSTTNEYTIELTGLIYYNAGS